MINEGEHTFRSFSNMHFYCESSINIKDINNLMSITFAANISFLLMAYLSILFMNSGSGKKFKPLLSFPL